MVFSYALPVLRLGSRVAIK
jgi:hypothetical protein